jgi:hypothetical protein
VEPRQVLFRVSLGGIGSQDVHEKISRRLRVFFHAAGEVVAIVVAVAIVSGACGLSKVAAM